MAQKKNVVRIKRRPTPIQAPIQNVVDNKVVNAFGDVATQKAVFSNYAIVQHTDNEFLIDFMQRFLSDALMTSRVVLTPRQMKALYKAIGTNIQRYEETYGEIKSGNIAIKK